ncbi:dihydrofolate reductase [Christensenellaceae bacterium OttesenSCG-928-K19]|nr:dihydrofolate reductase [Christensenellaceae bacterium OttesenSCG-928-K19]
MNFIVAVDENWGIGKDNALLFHLPEDLKYFKEKTSGKVVVMGEATLKSLPGSKPLPSRTNIVLSDDPAFFVEGAVMVRTMDALAEELKQYKDDDIFVIGGASVYNQLMDSCKRAYITKVKSSADADKSIYCLDGRQGWMLVEESAVQEQNGLEFVFTVYENNDVKPMA